MTRPPIDAATGLVGIAGRKSLEALIAKASAKRPGSSSHRKLFRHYCHRLSEDVRHELRRDIGSTVDGLATRSLEASLGAVGANRGIMPDFTDASALRGYALRHFGRARLLCDLMNLPEPDWLHHRIAELFRTRKTIDSKGRCENPAYLDLVSLGGGPGYDFVSATALSEYRAGPSVRATVYEYEQRWESVVSSVERATQNVLGNNRHTCGFDGCDITLPLTSNRNASVAKSTGTSQYKIFACSYCIAENAVALRNRDYIFFRELFEEADQGAVFLFPDTTHRLWPEMSTIAKEAGLYYTTPHVKSGKVGWHFVAFKDDHRPGNEYHTTAISDVLLNRFKADQDAHSKRLDRGWKREEKKIKGEK